MARLDADRAPSSSAPLPALLLDRAIATPDAVALLIWAPSQVAGQLSYADIVRSMLAAAAWLQEEVGLREGAVLPILAENSASYLALSLGGMSLGATALHLNWRQPAAVNANLLRSLEAVLLVASPHMQHDATELAADAPNVCLHVRDPAQRWAALSTAAAAALAKSARAVPLDATAAIFLTGGTTGRPKAVPHTHAGLRWLCDGLLAMCPAPFEPAEEAGALALMPYYHVMGFVASTLFCFLAGCRAYVLADAGNTQARQHFSPRAPHRTELQLAQSERPTQLHRWTPLYSSPRA